MNKDLSVDVQKKPYTVEPKCASCCKAINYDNQQDFMIH